MPSMRHLAVLSAVVTCAFEGAAGQGRGPDCWAPSASSTNLSVPGFMGKLTGIAAMERMRDSVAGEYRWIEHTTEGTGAGRWITESRVVIRPVAMIDTARRIGHLSYVIAEAEGHLIRSGPLGGKLVPPKDTGAFRLQARYVPPNAMTITYFDPRQRDLIITDDPRPIYDVTAIDSGGTIRGRWTGGGIAGLVVDTPAGTFGEMPAGYFCAIKETARRSTGPRKDRSRAP